MFIGHFALGYAAKRWAPHLSLAALFAAAQLADFLWPVFVAAGLERVRIVPGFTRATPLEFISYPYSHSLLALIVWGVLFGWLCARRSGPALSASRTWIALLVFLLVISHWALDVITHVPDMPLYPGGPTFGWGLWNHPFATKLIEFAMFATGVTIYLRATRARDRVGTWATWFVIAFLAIGFLASDAPPPSVTALWMAALILGGLTLGLAHWADRHRASIE